MIEVYSQREESFLVQVIQDGSPEYVELAPRDFITSEEMTEDLFLQEHFKFITLVSDRPLKVKESTKKLPKKPSKKSPKKEYYTKEDLEGMTKTDLVDLIDVYELDINKKLIKVDMIAALLTFDIEK